MPSRIKVLVALLVALATVSSLSSETLRTRADSVAQIHEYLEEARKGPTETKFRSWDDFRKEPIDFYAAAFDLITGLDSIEWEVALFPEVMPEVWRYEPTFKDLHLAERLYKTGNATADTAMQLKTLAYGLQAVQRLATDRSRWEARRDSAISLAIAYRDFAQAADWLVAKLYRDAWYNHCRKTAEIADSILQLNRLSDASVDWKLGSTVSVARVVSWCDDEVLRQRLHQIMSEAFAACRDGSWGGQGCPMLSDELAKSYLRSGADDSAAQVISLRLANRYVAYGNWVTDSLVWTIEALRGAGRYAEAIALADSLRTLTLHRLESYNYPDTLQYTNPAETDSILVYSIHSTLYDLLISSEQYDSALSMFPQLLVWEGHYLHTEPWAGRRASPFLDAGMVDSAIAVFESMVVCASGPNELPISVLASLGDLYMDRDDAARATTHFDNALAVYARTQTSPDPRLPRLNNDVPEEETFARIIRGRALAQAKLGPDSLARQFFDEWQAHADTLLWYDHLREIDSLKQAGFLE